MSNGQPLTIRVDVLTDTTQQIDSLELMQGYWRDVGIDLQVNVIDSALYRERQVANLYEAISNVGAGGLNELLNPRLYVRSTTMPSTRCRGPTGTTATTAGSSPMRRRWSS